jgi:hypothetical protein
MGIGTDFRQRLALLLSWRNDRIAHPLQNLPVADNYLAIRGNRNGRDGNGVVITARPWLLQCVRTHSLSWSFSAEIAFAEKF